MYCNNSINNGSDFPNLNINSESLLEDRKSYEMQYKNLFNFCLGIYENDQGFRLNIQEPYHFNNILQSLKIIEMDRFPFYLLQNLFRLKFGQCF